MENPYEPALGWIRKNPTTGSGVGLAKLILSLWNDDAAYSLRECCSSFDDIRQAWASKIITHFIQHGEDDFLVAAGKEVYRLCPTIWDIGYAGTEGKNLAIAEMERKREKALKKEHPELFDD